MDNGSLQVYIMDLMRNTKDGKIMGERIVEKAFSEHGVPRKKVEEEISHLVDGGWINGGTNNVFLELND